MRARGPAGLMLVFLLSGAAGGLAAQSAAGDLVIPARTIPGRVIPAHFIPGRTIPARSIPARQIGGITVPAMTIPAVVIPDTYIPRIVIPDVHLPRIVIPAAQALIRETPSFQPQPADHRRAQQGLMAELFPSPWPQAVRMSRADRDRAYRQASTQHSPQLLDLFAHGDLDRNGQLSWAELEAFQRSLHGRVVYRHNRDSLAPHVFLAVGGGDCEDWANLTVAFVRYWGWEATVSAWLDQRSGHAVALVRSPVPTPAGYRTVNLGLIAGNGVYADPGPWVPVDYEVVGGFSSAISPGMTFAYVIEPETTYGRPM